MCPTSLFTGTKKIIGRFQIFKYPTQHSEEPRIAYEYSFETEHHLRYWKAKVFRPTKRSSEIRPLLFSIPTNTEAL